MFKLRKPLWAIIFIAMSIAAGSAVYAAVTSSTTTIKEIYSYTVIGGGDVLLTLDTPPTGCDGFWLDSSDPGFKTVLSVALSAYQAQSPVMVYGDETQLFSGSSNNYCKATVVRLRPK